HSSSPVCCSPLSLHDALPILFALLGIAGAKPAWNAVFKNMPHPEYSALALRAMSVSWVLMALGWVALSHAISLYLNRSDPGNDRDRKSTRLNSSHGSMSYAVF